jgi:glycosyltransferase involved in cell wall biosynthesis
VNSKKYLLVVMPLYNAEDTVAQAIESILKQTYKNLILVIVDDSSTDGSLDIAKKYLTDKRVRIYSNTINMGAYYCRNFGLYAAADESWTHFTTHDADDISFSYRYKTLLQAMDKEPRVNGIQDIFDRIDTKEKRVVSSKVSMAHAMFTRKVFDKIGYFDLVRFGGDWEHWQRLKTVNKLDDFGKTKTFNEIHGESYIHDTNLTVLIPEDSPKRMRYMERAKKKIDKAYRTSSIYYSFTPERGFTKRILND